MCDTKKPKYSWEKVIITGLSLFTLLSANVSIADDPVSGEGHCFAYAVHDRGVNDSQMIYIDPEDPLNINKYGMEYLGCDLEAMDMDFSAPDGLGTLYVASGGSVEDKLGNDLCQPGQLYKVAFGGGLLPVGATGFKEVDGISFHPITNELWGWAEDGGLFKIPRGIAGPMSALDLDNVQVVLPATCGWSAEDLTWNLAGTQLCGVFTIKVGSVCADGVPAVKQPQKIICYDGETITTVCNEVMDNLPGCVEIEAINAMPPAEDTEDSNGEVMIGYNDCKQLPAFAKLDMATCALTDVLDLNADYDGILKGKPDIEGVAWPCPSPKFSDCDNSWQYMVDSDDDSTEKVAPYGPFDVAVGNTVFEIYGIAIKDNGDSIAVAINANLPLAGTDASAPALNVPDNNIGWGDLMLDLDEDHIPDYAVHFADSNDSGATEGLGLYALNSTKDVTAENHGWQTLTLYESAVLGQGGSVSFGAADPWRSFFDAVAMRAQPIEINEGSKVAELTLLNEAALIDMGLEVEQMGAVKAQLIGFQFDKVEALSNSGDISAFIFTECLNDGVVINTKICQ
jgi:hypothetical protein